MYVRYAESARINWAQNYAIYVDPANKERWSELWTPRGGGLILRSMRTDYKFVRCPSTSDTTFFSWPLFFCLDTSADTASKPMTWPDHISVFHKLRALPKADDSAFILDVMILSELHQRPAARCVEDIVVYDYKNGKKTAIFPFLMDGFRTTWEEQEAARNRNEERCRELEGIVAGLEKETWDREDAVEEVGGKS